MNTRNTIIEHRITEAMQKQEARTPNVQELGGGYYFTCHWLSCGQTLNKYWEYCPKCGQRIDWTDAKRGGFI